jgi:4-hydroxythreonine-4-phosphate dehydrogenase
MKPLLAISVGDCNGIGPEIVLKAVASQAVRRTCVPLLVGPETVFQFYRRKLGLRVTLQVLSPGFNPSTLHDARNAVWLLESSTVQAYTIAPGVATAEAGRAAAEAISTGTRLVRSGRAEALVTAPISKRALHLAGIDFPGHTEMLQHLTGSLDAAMMLVSRTLRVGLVTIHCPLRDVPNLLTVERITAKTVLVHEALRRDWGIRHPRIAILGLNPHAGENGDIGVEELSIIEPAVRLLNNRSIKAEGPFSADAFFARYRPTQWDAVIAMYHDQGLIPLKMTGRGKAVNITVGLPIVRTSPDHGTAFDIAGRGIADPASLIEAIKLAVMIARRRRAGTGRKPL